MPRMPQQLPLQSCSNSRQRPSRFSERGKAPSIPKPVAARHNAVLRRGGRGVPVAVTTSMADLVHYTCAYHSLRDVCVLRASSRHICDACSQDTVWENLYRLRWPLEIPGQSVPGCGWLQRFLHRLRQVHEAFVRRKLPDLARKSRRRDGLPDLRKLYESLQVRHIMSVVQPHAGTARLEFNQTSVQMFDSAVCLRCSFSSLRVTCPFRLEFVGRSATMGRQEVLLTADVNSLDDFSDELVMDETKFLRSRCGRLLLAFWGSSNTLAGIYANLSYHCIFQSLWSKCEAWDILAGRPCSDDLDSCLGLHSYALQLTLRSGKVESFSSTFYNLDSFRLSHDRAGSFGAVAASTVPGNIAEPGRYLHILWIRLPWQALTV